MHWTLCARMLCVRDSQICLFFLLVSSDGVKHSFVFCLHWTLCARMLCEHVWDSRNLDFPFWKAFVEKRGLAPRTTRHIFASTEHCVHACVGLARTIHIRCIRYFWQENHQLYGHIRCIYTVLANPTHVMCACEAFVNLSPFLLAAGSLNEKTHVIACTEHCAAGLYMC